MTRVIRFIAVFILIVSGIGHSMAQNVDTDRMDRDIKVAENVLATLIKQKFESKNMFFPLDVRGSYQAGYGVTFTLPPDFTTPIIFAFPDDADIIIDDAQGVSTYEYRVRKPQAAENNNRDWKLKDSKQRNMDSLRDVSNVKLVEAVQEFLADYGDILSQLKPEERIVVTNRGGGDQPKLWVGNLVTAPSRSHLSVELAKADLNQFRQNKITRDQLIKRIKVINAEAVEEVEPDLELLSTIFNRLYRADLSKTYFSEGNIYYERLKDFGAIYYMNMFSASRNFNGLYDMPTQGLTNLSQEDRDKRARELYPSFEKELKENVIEYGRTIKSLKDDENLIFNVKVTRCYNCKIPESLEMTVKGSVLKDYNSGKIDKTAALGKVSVKKGAEQ
jgi:hypothetical protein